MQPARLPWDSPNRATTLRCGAIPLSASACGLAGARPRRRARLRLRIGSRVMSTRKACGICSASLAGLPEVRVTVGDYAPAALRCQSQAVVDRSLPPQGMICCRSPTSARPSMHRRSRRCRISCDPLPPPGASESRRAFRTRDDCPGAAMRRRCRRCGARLPSANTRDPKCISLEWPYHHGDQRRRRLQPLEDLAVTAWIEIRRATTGRFCTSRRREASVPVPPINRPRAGRRVGGHVSEAR